MRATPPGFAEDLDVAERGRDAVWFRGKRVVTLALVLGLPLLGCGGDGPRGATERQAAAARAGMPPSEETPYPALGETVLVPARAADGSPLPFALPSGFVAERVAGPPLLKHPMFACFD